MDTDIDAVAAGVCAEHGLAADQCATLREGLAVQRPADPWLAPGDWSREAWLES